MESSLRWWILRGLDSRPCFTVPWWHRASFLSQDIHIFSRLPREVKFFYATKRSNTDELISLRILIVSIQNLGKCPCPHCCIPLKQVHQMGMPRDSNQCLTLARVDGIHRQGTVTAARCIIYDMHYPVNSAAVEALLKDESLTPNIVWFIFLYTIIIILIIYKLCRMCSLYGWDR